MRAASAPTARAPSAVVAAPRTPGAKTAAADGGDTAGTGGPADGSAPAFAAAMATVADTPAPSPGAPGNGAEFTCADNAAPGARATAKASTERPSNTEQPGAGAEASVLQAAPAATGAPLPAAAALESGAAEDDGAAHGGGPADMGRGGKRGSAADGAGSDALTTLAVLLGMDGSVASAALAMPTLAPASASAAAADSTGGDASLTGLHDEGIGGQAQRLADGQPRTALEPQAAVAPGVGAASGAAEGPSVSAGTPPTGTALGAAPAGTVSTPATGDALLPTALAQLLSLPTAAAAAAGTGAAAIAVPVSDASWPHALAAQVQWMATAHIQSATLRLSPEHLGPLEVHIDVTRSQINVSFNAHHAETRAALAEAVPRLRELFSAGGLNLGQATVQQESGSAGQQRSGAARTPEPQTVEPVANTAIRRLGLVDEYA